jgi:hypothetical protein
VRSWREILGFGQVGPRPLPVPTANVPLPRDCSPAVPVSPSAATALSTFLNVHYRTGSGGNQGPIYTISGPELKWYLDEEIMNGMLIYNSDRSALVGCCLSRQLGVLVGAEGPTEISLRLISEFCVRRDRRGSGIASYLLSELLRYLRPETSYIFLKEGAPLPGAGPPLYSGQWVYRRVKRGERESRGRVQRLDLYGAVRTAWHFGRRRRREAQMIINRPAQTHPKSTRSYLYKGFRGSILLNVSPAGQVHPQDGREIAYMTGWVEDGELLDQERRDAAIAASAAAARDFNAPWIWFDAEAVGPLSNQSCWKADGPYHWYAFGWTPGSKKNSVFLFI